tara:strand:- start:1224 stop:1952 length:729 start_codon:yes stop_codon:yes gene_type:complete
MNAYTLGIAVCFKLVLLLCLMVSGCTTPKKAEKPVETKLEGLVHTYDEEGNVRTSINYQDNKKHGKSYLYYDNSQQVLLEMTYENGMRTDTAYKYYSNGDIYRKTPYENDRVHGQVQVFYRNGQLQAQVPYHMGYKSTALVEYKLNGEMKELPGITVRRELKDGNKIIFVNIENCDQANYYIGNLAAGKYFIEGSKGYTVVPQINDEGYFKITNNSPTEVNVFCTCITKSNFPYITTTSVKL